jgi:hypothetical protein
MTLTRYVYTTGPAEPLSADMRWTGLSPVCQGHEAQTIPTDVDVHANTLSAPAWNSLVLAKAIIPIKVTPAAPTRSNCLGVPQTCLAQTLFTRHLTAMVLSVFVALVACVAVVTLSVPPLQQKKEVA